MKKDKKMIWNGMKCIAKILGRGVLVLISVVLCVAAAWAVSKGCAIAFSALELGLTNLAMAVWKWNWWSKFLAVCVLSGVTYLVPAATAGISQAINAIKTFCTKK